MGQARSDGERQKLTGEAIHFRPFTKADIPSLIDIEQQSFRTPWTAAAFQSELTDNALAHYTVAVYGDRVVGYCGLWLIFDEAHVTNIAVHPQFRGAKIGEGLFMYAMSLAKIGGAQKMTLEVRPSNKVALNLYTKLGFVHTGTRPGYYQDDHEDAWIMWVRLDDDYFSD